MTIPTDQAIDVACRHHACELFGVATDTAPDDCRRAVLAQLDQADYVPHAAWHASIEMLFETDSEQDDDTWTSKSALRDEVESSVGDEIEEFATRFFEIEPGERTRIWNSLCERAKFSAVLSRWLLLLEPGVNVDISEIAVSRQDPIGRLVCWIIAIFPLRSSARSATWNLARDAMRNSPLEWEGAAEQVHRACPGIAQLVPELLAEARTLTVQRNARERQLKSRKRAAKRKEWFHWRSVANIGGGALKWAVVLIVFSGIRSGCRIPI